MLWGQGGLLVIYSSRSKLQPSITNVKWLKYNSVLHVKIIAHLAVVTCSILLKKSWEWKKREIGEQVANLILAETGEGIGVTSSGTLSVLCTSKKKNPNSQENISDYFFWGGSYFHCGSCLHLPKFLHYGTASLQWEITDL